jgi:hypothetical protein
MTRFAAVVYILMILSIIGVGYYVGEIYLPRVVKQVITQHVEAIDGNNIHTR